MKRFDNPRGGKRRRAGWFAALLLALLALAYAGLWLHLAVGVQDRVLAWIEEQRARGMTVRYDSLESSGFPLAIRLHIANPGIGAPHAALPWGWEGEHLQLLARPWSREAIQVRTWGQQMLAFPFAGRMATHAGTLTEGRASARFSGSAMERLELSLHGLSLRPEPPGRTDLAVAEGKATAWRGDGAAWALSLSARELSLPWLQASPLSRTVQGLTAEAHLRGGLESGPLIESLENWRDGGGTVEIGEFALRHGPLRLSADGTLALDAGLQPIGAMTARITGFFETVDALKKQGLVKPRDAVTAKMVLGVLSRRPADGGPASLNLPLTLQERRLYAGPVGLLQVPEVDWRKF